MNWWEKITSILRKDKKLNRLKVTENFYLDEFRCKDGTPYPHEWVESRLMRLCEQLETIRDYFGGKPITILSAYRTVAHNRKIGGARLSRHLSGIAVDFIIKDCNPRVVAKGLEEMIADGKIQDGGIGDYSTFTHYDVRGRKSRWSGR